MSTDSGKLIEVIYPLLVFRNEAAFSIPKPIRERGYIQSLDIQISSVDWNIYENSKALPNIQFYGYAQLVMQDSCTIEVPIKYPRQRIWHIRIEDALSQWRDIHTWHNGALEWNEWFFNFFTQSQDPPIPLPPIEYPDTNFVESPLREVFVQVKDSCQFEIELTQWEPVPFVGRNAKTYDGKSRQVDGDKDGGLPSEGIQPRKNSSSDPFAGNREPSVLSFEGGFFAGTDKLTDAVDEYEPILPPFEGGQCEGVAYTVTLRLTRLNVDGSVDGYPSLDPRVVSAQGKILGLFVQKLQPTPSNGFEIVRAFLSTTQGLIAMVGSEGTGGTGIIDVSAEFISVERTDGLDDECGSLPVSDPTQV